MSDIVGVAATAAELVATCFSLLEKMKKIKGASSTLEKYNQQLKELSKLSDSVSNNPLLQTPEIGAQTQAILSIIEGNSFESLLNKRGFLRTLGFIYRERDILDALANLESRKATLSLAIEDIQSQALHEIKQEIKTMANRSSHSGRKSSRKSTRKSRSSHESEATSTSLGVGDSSDSASMTRSESSRNDGHLINLPPNVLARRQSPTTESFFGMPSASIPQQSDGQPRVYDGIRAGRRVSQINGNVIHMPDKVIKEPLKEFPGDPAYSNIEKYGDGAQINGQVLIQHTNEYAPEFPHFGGTWKNITFNESPDSDNTTAHNSSDRKRSKKKTKKEKSKKEKSKKEKNKKRMQFNGGIMLREDKPLFPKFDFGS